MPRRRIGLDHPDIGADAGRQIRVAGEGLALHQQVHRPALDGLIGGVRQRHLDVVVLPSVPFVTFGVSEPSMISGVVLFVAPGSA